MRLTRDKMIEADMKDATRRAKRKVESSIELANKLINDSDKDKRLAQQECKACFYYFQIAGAAVTEKPCMSCGVAQTYGSTHAATLCLECSKANDLCKQCGGDINMDTTRKDWPNPTMT